MEILCYLILLDIGLLMVFLTRYWFWISSIL